jgi:CheY-like chemotaxis protein
MACILVVDDNEEIRRFIRRVVESEGHAVMEAANGRAAMERVGEQAVELVISDIFMPESDGLELLRALRKRAPELRVIAISGGGNLGNMDILHAARLFGAYRVFTKPFATEDLILAIREALSPNPPPPAG